MSLYMNAYAVPVICSSPSNLYIQSTIEKDPYLRGIELAESIIDNKEEIEVLIGADYYWNFMTGRARRWENPCPVAIQIKLGLALSGPIVANEAQESTINFSSTHVLRIYIKKKCSKKIKVMTSSRSFPSSGI